MNGERLVILLGLHGMHKSAVARNAIHFMIERKYFTGGAISISLKNVKHFRQFCEEIKKKISKSVSNREQLNHIQNEQFTDFLIDFFNQKNIVDKIKSKKHMNSEEHRFLLCLDGAEELISNSSHDLGIFLSRVLNECKTLSTVITTSRTINMLANENCIAPKIQLLNPLKKEESVDLFVQIAETITIDEIYDLILAEPNYPIKKLVDVDFKQIQRPVSEELEKKIR